MSRATFFVNFHFSQGAFYRLHFRTRRVGRVAVVLQWWTSGALCHAGLTSWWLLAQAPESPLDSSGKIFGAGLSFPSGGPLDRRLSQVEGCPSWRSARSFRTGRLRWLVFRAFVVAGVDLKHDDALNVSRCRNSFRLLRGIAALAKEMPSAVGSDSTTTPRRSKRSGIRKASRVSAPARSRRRCWSAFALRWVWVRALPRRVT